MAASSGAHGEGKEEKEESAEHTPEDLKRIPPSEEREEKTFSYEAMDPTLGNHFHAIRVNRFKHTVTPEQEGALKTYLTEQWENNKENADLNYMLGYLLLIEFNNVPHNQQGIRLLKMAADAGHPDAVFQLAVTLESERSPLSRLSSEKGFYKYMDVSPREQALAKEETLAYYRKAAERHHIAGMTNLAFFLAKSSSHPATLNEGLQWLEKTVEGGGARAKLRLGEYYQVHLKNERTAFQWYRLAYEEGEQNALIHLREIGRKHPEWTTREEYIKWSFDFGRIPPIKDASADPTPGLMVQAREFIEGSNVLLPNPELSCLCYFEAALNRRQRDLQGQPPTYGITLEKIKEEMEGLISKLPQPLTLMTQISRLGTLALTDKTKRTEFNALISSNMDEFASYYYNLPDSVRTFLNLQIARENLEILFDLKSANEIFVRSLIEQSFPDSKTIPTAIAKEISRLIVDSLSEKERFTWMLERTSLKNAANYFGALKEKLKTFKDNPAVKDLLAGIEAFSKTEPVPEKLKKGRDLLDKVYQTIENLRGQPKTKRLFGSTIDPSLIIKEIETIQQRYQYTLILLRREREPTPHPGFSVTPSASLSSSPPGVSSAMSSSSSASTTYAAPSSTSSSTTPHSETTPSATPTSSTASSSASPSPSSPPSFSSRRK